jgi:hypothetical protein
VDGELVQTTLGVGYGVSDRVSVGLKLPLEVRGGGALDSPIDEFHEAFDLPSGGREKEPQDQFLISGRLDDDTLFAEDDSGFVVPALTGSTSYLLTPGDESVPAQAVRTGLRVPVQSDELHDDSFGLTLDYSLSKRFGRIWLYGTTSVGGFTERRVGPFEERHVQVGGAVACEVAITDALSAGLGLWGSSQAVTNVIGLPDSELYLDVSANIGVSDDSELELLFRQNPETTGTADVTFLVGISKRLAL